LKTNSHYVHILSQVQLSEILISIHSYKTTIVYLLFRCSHTKMECRSLMQNRVSPVEQQKEKQSESWK